MKQAAYLALILPLKKWQDNGEVRSGLLGEAGSSAPLKRGRGGGDVT